MGIGPAVYGQMGSPFLLAHGIGKPVQDASTEVMIPKKGTWHVYARTWNWCSPWKVKEAPGRFKIAVNGQFWIMNWEWGHNGIGNMPEVLR